MKWSVVVLLALLLQVQVGWNDVSTQQAPVSQYRIERSDNGGVFFTIGLVNPPFQSIMQFMDPAPLAGVQHVYRVISVGAFEASSASSRPYTVFTRMTITP